MNYFYLSGLGRLLLSRLDKQLLSDQSDSSVSHDASVVAEMSHVMRKPAFCMRVNSKFVFLYIDGTMPLLSKSEVSSL